VIGLWKIIIKFIRNMSFIAIKAMAQNFTGS
jgi:hypothetical protein